MLERTLNLNVQGTYGAPILVVCEPLSFAADHERGWVMADQAMRAFGAMATNAGFEAQDFFFISCAPPIPEAEQATKSKEKKFAAQYQEELHNYIRAHSGTLKAVLYLGSLAGQMALGRDVKITKERGQVVSSAKLPVQAMGMFSPGHMLRKPEVRELVESDFNSLMSFKRAGWDAEQAFTRGVKNADYRWVFNIDELVATPPKAAALDTETIGFHREGFTVAPLLTVQLTVEEGKSLVLPVNHNYWNSHVNDDNYARAVRPKFITDMREDQERDPTRAEYLSHYQEFRTKYPLLTEAHTDHMMAQVKTVLENPRTAFSLANGKYDSHVFAARGIHLGHWFMDTQQAAFCMDENMENKGLDEITRRWCADLAGYADIFNRTWDKSRMDLIPPWELINYCAADTDAVFRLTKFFVREIRKDKRQWDTLMKIQMPTLRAFLKMERLGVTVSSDRLRVLGETADQAEATLYTQLIQRVPAAVRQAHMQEGGAEALRFSRDKFTADTLFSSAGFGIKPIKFTPATSGKSCLNKIPSVSTKQHLPFFVDFKTKPDAEFPTGYPFILNLIQYQKIQKLRSTYVGNEMQGNGFWQYICPDSKIRPSFFIHDTVTGRSSSRNPNGQNLPKRAKRGSIMEGLVKSFRGIFRASPGFKLLECIAEGSLVHTSNAGLVPIQGIQPSDAVNTDEGFKPVSLTKFNGIRPTLKVSADDGSHLITTGNHPWRVVRNGVFMWIEAKDLLASDWLVVPDNKPEDEIFEAPNCEAYWAGQFIGDGNYSRQTIDENGIISVGGYQRINFAFGLDWEEMYPQAEEFFGIISHMRNVKGDFYFQSKAIYDRWVVRTPKKGSWTADIPQWVLEGDKATRLSFLAGLIDSDGSYHSRRMTIVSVSETLIRQTHTLARSVGIHGIIRRIESGETKAWGFDVFELESMKRLPAGRLSRKRRIKESFSDKEFTQCRSAMIPMELMEKLKRPGMQTTMLSNRLFSNGRRKGKVTRDSIRKAAEENTVCESLLPILNFRYIKLLSVEDAGNRKVYDIEVPERHCFECGGFIVHNCDASQAELRIAAWMSGDPVMIGIYANDGDIHTMTAASTMGISVDEFSLIEKGQRDLYRFYAKAQNFGLIFGAQAPTLQNYAKIEYELDWTLEQAEEMRAKFFRMYPYLERWHESMRLFARRHGYVRSLHGAIRRLPGINSSAKGVRSESERQSINSPVQRMASDLGLIAMSRLARDTDWSIVRPLMFIHDALVVEVREDVYEQSMGWVKYYMETPPLQQWFGLESPVPFKADVCGGDSLLGMEEYKSVIATPPPFFRPDLD